MLFRYDSITGKPVQVLFIDLQLSRERDPFADVNYALYVSTTEDLRQKHLTSMLHIYYDTFSQICKNYSVPTLPGWSWERNIQPNVPFDRCPLHHRELVVAGRIRYEMADGTAVEASPGDHLLIEPGHQATVLGDEACVLLDW